MQCWAQGGGGATSSSWRLTACMALWLIVFRVPGCTVNDPGGTQHYLPYLSFLRFSLIYMSTIKVQHNHKYFIWTICLKSINNVLDLHLKMCQLEKIMKHFHLPLVRRWKAVTLLRVHFSKQSDSVWNSTQLPRNQLRNQQPDIFSSKLIFSSRPFWREKIFPPWQRYFTTALDKQGCWLSIRAIFAKCKCRQQSVPQIFAPDTRAVSLGACVRSKMSHQREF